MSWINRIADALENETAAKTFQEKLVEWGWNTPDGTPLTWEYWNRRARWPVSNGTRVEYLPPFVRP